MDIISKLSLMMHEEGKEIANWDLIIEESERLLKYLNSAGLARNFNSILYRYIEEYESRRRDPAYGEWQLKTAIAELGKVDEASINQPYRR